MQAHEIVSNKLDVSPCELRLTSQTHALRHYHMKTSAGL